MVNVLLICGLILTIGAIIAFIFFKKTISPKELAIQVFVQIALVSIVIGFMFLTDINDTQVLSSEVVSKKQVKVGCRHSYDCMCYQSCSGSGSNQSCSTICQTCYDHSHDFDWEVNSKDLGSVNIDKIDRQGLKTPPRWEQVKIGDPFSRKYSFNNYIKAAPDTLFSISEDNMKFFQNKIPEYPRQIYDYYKTTRVVTVGKVKINHSEWNDKLAEIHKKISPYNHANIIFVITDINDPSYRYALEASWKGGKVNDVIVLIGSPNFPEILWVDVISYGRNKGNELTSIMIRDALIEYGTVDLTNINLVGDIVFKKFDKVNVEDFKYLKSTVELSSGKQIGLGIFSLLLFIGLTIFFHKNEV